jgi:methylase of polypeptide subunit release factors
MKTRGVIYDAGTVYGTGLISVSTRLAFDRTTTRRELEIIGTDLHCNAVRIVADPAPATVSGGYVRAGGDPDTEGYFDASG